LLLGGITYISSSGVIAKILAELERLNNRETPTIVSILVFEDFAMAVYLPLVAVLLIGQGISQAILSVLVALLAVEFIVYCGRVAETLVHLLLTNRMK
jgi:CPA2 family monovalent cation:H+ antiporter-2